MNQPQTVTAKLRYLRIAPRKTRLVAGFIRGLPAQEAEAQLMFSSRHAGVPLLKLLRSAVANAKHNYRLDAAQLFIKEIKVDQGPKFKRWMPRARGSASAIEKKTSHVTLVLGVSEKLKQPKFIIRPKPKKQTTKKVKEKKETKAKEALKGTAKEVKPVKQPGFFHRVFRRKSI